MVRTRLAVLAVLATAAAGCNRVRPLPAPNTPVSAPAPAAASAIPDFDDVPLGNPPGSPIPGTDVKNPLMGDPATVEEGKTLYGAMNCAYCHNANGAGLIGPSLQGPGWRYGGSPIQIYASIHDGRPKGMPAWGRRLPSQEIWKIVAYIQTLGGASPPATDNTPPSAPSVTGPQVMGEKPVDAARQAQAAADARKP